MTRSSPTLANVEGQAPAEGISTAPFFTKRYSPPSSFELSAETKLSSDPPFPLSLSFFLLFERSRHLFSLVLAAKSPSVRELLSSGSLFFFNDGPA